MTVTLLMKARANRIAALQSIASRTGANVFSLEDARRRREGAAPLQVFFASRRAA